MKLIPDDPIVACMMRTGYPPWIRDGGYEGEEQEDDDDVPCSD